MAAVFNLFGAFIGTKIAGTVGSGLIDPPSGIVGLIIVGSALIGARQHPGRTTRGFRYAQTLSAAAMALGHGLQDAGKTMGIIVLALTVGGYQKDSSIPLWVKVSTALVISAGTYSGGWRIMRTLGRKIIHLDPPQGFAAETSGASILYIAGLGFGAPI
jgi:PiT family inorganic phosphate transporter